MVPIPTPGGVFTARFTEQGLAGIEFPGRASRVDAAKAGGVPRDWVRLTEAALGSALAGLPVGGLPPLDWRGGTSFQQQVWKALLQIPAGRTRTYAELAVATGHPGAARAVGSACGANPIPVLVPCHRVVRSGGGLGGFSGGLGWKETLLRREGALP